MSLGGRAAERTPPLGDRVPRLGPRRGPQRRNETAPTRLAVWPCEETETLVGALLEGDDSPPLGDENAPPLSEEVPQTARLGLVSLLNASRPQSLSLVVAVPTVSRILSEVGASSTGPLQEAIFLEGGGAPPPEATDRVVAGSRSEETNAQVLDSWIKLCLLCNLSMYDTGYRLTIGNSRLGYSRSGGRS